jgi:hypothetical protein
LLQEKLDEWVDEFETSRGNKGKQKIIRTGKKPGKKDL